MRMLACDINRNLGVTRVYIPYQGMKEKVRDVLSLLEM